MIVQHACGADVPCRNIAVSCTPHDARAAIRSAEKGAAVPRLVEATAHNADVRPKDKENGARMHKYPDRR